MVMKRKNDLRIASPINLIHRKEQRNGIRDKYAANASVNQVQNVEVIIKSPSGKEGDHE